VRGILPWANLPAPRTLGQGQKGVARIEYPQPDDPRVLCCLNCELPGNACYAHEGCPYGWRARVVRRARGAARQIAQRDMARAVEEVG
jgi:hypothetical protein